MKPYLPGEYCNLFLSFVLQFENIFFRVNVLYNLNYTQSNSNPDSSMSTDTVLLRFCFDFFLLFVDASELWLLILARLGVASPSYWNQESTSMCHRASNSPRVVSRMSCQWAISSGPDEFRPKLNQPTISLRFILRLAYIDTISVTSFNWNRATCEQEWLFSE